MSEPRDPDLPPSPPEEEHRHHGLKEQLREEIGHAVETVEHAAEEVVEHIPRRVRWTFGKLMWLVALSVVGVLVLLVVTGLLYLANRTQLVAREITVVLNQTLALRSDLEFEIKDIKGNPLTGVRLIQPRVRFRTGDAPPLLEAPAMTVRYSAWNLIFGQGAAIDVGVDRPVVRVSRGPDGKLRLPQWKSGAPDQSVGRAYELRLRIRDGTVMLPDPERNIAGLELDAGLDTGTPTRITLRDLRWKRGPWGSVLERMDGELTAADSVRFRLDHLKSGDLDLAVRGAWKADSRVRSETRQFQIEVKRVRWRWLARVFDNDSFDVDGEGRLTADLVQEGSDLSGRFATSLTWADEPVRATGAMQWSHGRLVVDPLVGSTAGGRLAGRVIWSQQGWELSGEARDADPSHWGAIGIDGWPAGRLNGALHYTVDSRGRVNASKLAVRLVGSELSGWRVDSAVVAVKFPAARPDTFTVTGERRGGNFRLLGNTFEGGWRGVYDIERLPLDEWPDGRSSGIHGLLSHGRGTVEDRNGVLHVTGALDGVATDWLGAHAAGWRLARLDGALLPKSDLSAACVLSDVSFLGVHFDSVAAPFHLGDQTIAFDTLRAVAADSVFTLSGNAAWSAGSWRMTLTQASAASRQFDWHAEPPLVLVGDPKGVTFERLVADDRDAHLNISGHWAGPGGNYDWSASAQRLELGRIGMQPDWQLDGNADLELKLSGAFDEPRWSFDARCSRPGFHGHHADSLSVALAGAPSRLEVRAARLALDGGALTVAGVVDPTERTEPDTLTGEGVMRWVARARHWQGTVRAARMPLDHLDRLVPAAGAWSGRVTGTLEIAGRPGAPELTLNGESRPLRWGDYRADLVTLRAAYRAGRLEVPSLELTRSGVVSNAHGSMPLTLALGQLPAVPDSAMTWRVDIPNGDLAVVPLFLPQIGSAAGKFELAAELRGTFRRPDLEGTLRVRDGTLRMAEREEVLEGVRADLELNQSRITLDSLSARQGSSGRVSGRGVVEVSGLKLKSYQFKLNLRDFTAVETGQYAAVFDGDFVVTDGPRFHGQTLPLVTGSARLKEGRILFDFANQSEVQQIASTTQPLFWNYKIQLTANNNLHWVPPDGDLEFSADLSMEQTADSLLIYGEMHALRGSYYFLSNRFDVRVADLTFDNLNGVNPVLNIQADTKLVPSELPVTGPSVPPNQQEIITVTITGRSNAPQIGFSSQPRGLDEAQILKELTLLRIAPGGAVSFQSLDPLDNYLTRALNRQLSSEMSRAFSGYINQWEIQRESGGLVRGEGGVILSLGSQVTDRLLLRYSQRLPGFLDRPENVGLAQSNPFERDVEAEYRLNRFFFITTEVRQRRNLIGTTTTTSNGPDFNVNLKARWEY